MNKEQIRKSVGHLVRLVPIANRLDPLGYPLPQIDDEWRIDSVTDEGVRLSLARTGHARTLGFDNLHHYSSDRVERGETHGFLVLNVQLTIHGNDIHVTPTRPGEPVAPRIPTSPIRRALLQQLNRCPGTAIPAGALTEFSHRDVIDEIVRCEAEGLIEARLLRGGGGVVDAVAVRLGRRGADWLGTHGF